MNNDAQSPDMSPGLAGRTGEREEIGKALDSARRGFSATLVVRGEAGIGKTALLEDAVGSAPDFRVLRVTGIESEMELGFAGLHQLSETLLPEIAGLPGPQRAALESAFGLADGPAPDRFLVGLAVLTLLTDAAAGDRGVLCAVDDAQWLDQASADVLAFVARRSHADRIAFLFAVRDGAGYQAPFEGLDSMTVRGLPADSARQMMAGLVGGVIDPGVGDQIARRASGNPLALAELTRELTAEQLAGAALLPDPLPLAADVRERYWRKVAALPPDQRELLALAAAEPSGDPDLFERAAAHLGLDARLAFSGPVGQLVEVTDHVTFRHPLIRSAAYEGSPYPVRRRAHAALAAASDPERDADRIAWHRAAAAREPDEEIAALLERSADRARGRGGLAASAAFWRRAAELTPDGDRQAGRLLAAARTEFLAGRAAQALALLDQAGPRLREARGQAAALRLRGAIQTALGDGHQAPGTLLRAARALAPLSPRAAREALLEALFAAFYSGGRALDDAVAACAAAGPARDTARASVPDLVLDGFVALRTSGASAAAPFLRRALAALCADDLPVDRRLSWYGYGLWCAHELFDFDALRLMADRWVRICRDRGMLTMLPLALDYLGMVQCYAGQLSAAEASNTEGREILAATGAPDRMGIRTVEVLLPAWRGQDAALQRAAADMTRDCAERGQGFGVLYPHSAFILAGIGAGDYEAALRHARVLLDDDSPYLGGVVLPDAVEAAVHRGDLPTAELALARLTARAEASRAPTALGLLARCRALLAGAAGEDAACAELFAESVARFGDCTTARVADLARTRLLYGEWLRRKRRRREAVRELRAAHAAFETIGAAAFAERARLELAAAGDRGSAAPGRARNGRAGGPAAGGQLTERESQIARLVIGGATNADVAAQLFISANTVDYHLKHVYRKLGVPSRTMLAARYRDRL